MGLAAARLTSPAQGQVPVSQVPAPPARPPDTAPPGKEIPTGSVVLSTSRASVALGGYAEVFCRWNFNQPAGGITHEHHRCALRRRPDQPHRLRPRQALPRRPRHRLRRHRHLAL